MELLIRNSENHDCLVANPGLIPDAVEKFLRDLSPVHAFARTATRATVPRGQQIEERQLECFWLVPLAMGLANEMEASGRLMGSKNQIEAVMAKLEKRPANFADPEE